MRQGVDCKGRIWIERQLGKLGDLTNHQFTRLIVLFPVYVQGMSKKRAYWLCRCECGKEIACRSDCLQNQHIQSCGCMTVDGVYKKSQDVARQMIGKRFGKLTVKQFVGYKLDSVGVNKALYQCSCDCGNDDFIVMGNSLNCGLTLSCGCLNRSVGEINVENILKENQIYFKSEYVFPDLRSCKDGYLRYDFALLDSNNIPIRLIEFDGEQHFKPIDCFGGEEMFYIRQQNDMLKNQYAMSHNIPLVRLPYFLRDTMTIEDLMEDKYLISTIQN